MTECLHIIEQHRSREKLGRNLGEMRDFMFRLFQKRNKKITVVLLAAMLASLFLIPLAAPSYAAVRERPDVDPQSPADGQKHVRIENPIVIRFWADVAEPTLRADTVSLRKSGSSKDVEALLSFNERRNELTIQPLAPLDVKSTYIVSLSRDVETIKGERLGPFSYRFSTIEKDAFYITGQTPEPYADQLPLKTSVTVRFSNELMEESINEKGIYMQPASTRRNVPVTLEYDRSDKVVRLIPKEPLLPNTEYRVFVSTSLYDKGGSSMPAVQWSFKTIAENIHVLSRTPGLGAINVPTDITPSFVLSKDIQARSARPENIYLREAGSISDLPTKIRFDQGNNTVTIHPSVELAVGTTYEIHITDRVVDTEGRPVVPEVWRFTTAPYRPDPIQQGSASKPLVRINGQYLSFKDTAPLMKNGRVMVPYRAIFEKLGAEVGFDNSNPAKPVISGVLGDRKIILTPGHNKALLGNKEIILDAAPEVIGGRTLVPLRFVGESLGLSVTWDAKTANVLIENK